MKFDLSARIKRLAELRSVSELVADDISIRRTYARLLSEVTHAFHSSATGSTIMLTGCPACTGFAVAYSDPKFVTFSLSPDDIETFIFTHYQLLDSHGLALGTWKDWSNSEEMVLPTEIVRDLPTAMTRAKERGQREIFDLGNGRSLSVGS